LPQFSVQAPETADEWQAYYDLRWRVLRAPWGQPLGSERDELEDGSVHRMLCDARGRVLAVGRVHMLGSQTAQIRYMAVEDSYQGQGLGSRILEQLEQAAMAAGCTSIVLDAREAALPFYQRHGYQRVSRSHLLFGRIQHFRMSKPLGPDRTTG
jgi:GNAT superfamily N-acetyltransferase